MRSAGLVTLLVIIIVQTSVPAIMISPSYTGYNSTNYIYPSTKYYLNITIGGTITNEGNETININETDLLVFDYPLNTSDQEVLGVKAIANGTEYNYTIIYEEDHNTLVINASDIENALLEPGESIDSWVKYNVTIDMSKRTSPVMDLLSTDIEYPEKAVKKSGAWNDINITDEKYLNTTKMWNITHPLVKLLYKYVRREMTVTDKPLAYLLAAIDWLDINVVYSTRIPARHPWEVIVEGAGDCDDQSNLLITLLRAAGIPSYLEIGLLYLRNNFRHEHTEVNGLFHYIFIGGGGHGWVAAYIPPWRWIRIDMTSSMGKGFGHIKYAAYYLTPIVITSRVYKGDYAEQSARFTENIRKTRLKYDIIVSILRYNP